MSAGQTQRTVAFRCEERIKDIAFHISVNTSVSVGRATMWSNEGQQSETKVGRLVRKVRHRNRQLAMIVYSVVDGGRLYILYCSECSLSFNTLKRPLGVDLNVAFLWWYFRFNFSTIFGKNICCFFITTFSFCSKYTKNLKTKFPFNKSHIATAKCYLKKFIDNNFRKFSLNFENPSRKQLLFNFLE